MGIREKQGGGGATFIDIKGKPQKYTDDKGNERVGALVMAPEQRGGQKRVLSSFTTISGIVADAEVHISEFEGEEITSLKVKLVEDGEKPVVLTATLGSFLGAKFAGLIRAALEQPGKPIEFAAGYMQEGDKLPGGKVVERGGTWMKIMQDGVRLEPLYANGARELPEAPEVKMNGKTFRNMDAVNAATQATVLEIYSKLDIGDGHVEDDASDDGLAPDEVAGAAQLAGQQGGTTRDAMRARG